MIETIAELGQLVTIIGQLVTIGLVTLLLTLSILPLVFLGVITLMLGDDFPLDT